MRKSSSTPAGASVDPAELARFAAMADDWWAPDGKFAPLHRLNPVRLRFIRDSTAAHYGRDANAEQPLKDLRILDIGCGGGLLCEPLTRLGARITGIDAGAEAIAIAQQHAEDAGLTIDYRHTSAEELAASGVRFDVVLVMELVEHVTDPAAFIATAATLLDDGGIMILSTLNRTPKAFLQAIVGAEYVLRWLPRGTHDWRKFLRPSELAAMARGGGLAVEEIVGLSYSPLTGTWRISRDTDVNYMLRASKP
ncbi:MAG: bifunctional 2-polyprenyl-6-hydroxyphenol methylase/3-demethylubiquinol 3-O-methyltransferase UbiG [Alphaproteobacteria bacterium]